MYNASLLGAKLAHAVMHVVDTQLPRSVLVLIYHPNCPFPPVFQTYGLNNCSSVGQCRERSINSKLSSENVCALISSAASAALYWARSDHISTGRMTSTEQVNQLGNYSDTAVNYT
jgi:hypothetical protein